jgi:hypothetical protein
VYGPFCSSFLGIRITAIDHFFVKDTLAFLIIVWCAVKRRARGHIDGMPSLLDKIVRDATTYFLVIFTSHLLLILFEFFAPVSDILTLVSLAHDRLHIDIDSTPSCEVSHRSTHCNEDESDQVLYYL